MKRGIRITGLVLLLGLFTALGGCVYPAYYQRPGVVYSDDGQYRGGNAAVDAYDDDGYVDGYYASPGYYYNPWWGYGPYIGLGFYGSYWGGWGGGHRGGYHGPWRGGYHGGVAHGGAHMSAPSHGGGGHH